MKSASSAGKGHWNDPDLLLNNAYTEDYSSSLLANYDERRTVFAMWSFSKAPLIMGNVSLSN